VPPTFAAVYCLGPTLAQLFSDAEVGIDLAGLIHAEQTFEWPEQVRPGDVVDATTEITAVDAKRGMTFVRLAMEATRSGDQAVVCRGAALMIVRSAA
jgi:acyl dehydratase